MRLKTIAILTIITFVSCTNNSEKKLIESNVKELPIKTTQVEILSLKEVKVVSVSNDVFEVRLTNHIRFNWSNKTQSIVHDDLYKSVKASFESIKDSIAAQIPNKQTTPGKVCSTEQNLTVGQLAFILIDDIVGIPYFSVLGVQFDVITCSKYPDGLFEYIDKNPEKVKPKVVAYLKEAKYLMKSD